MQEFANLDELDLALLNALQIHPRATWAAVAAALEVDPVTVARRWNRLAEAGYAWITCYPGPALADAVSLAFVEVDCAGTVPEVAEATARMPHVATVEHTTGTRDLLLTVLTHNLGALSRFLLADLDAFPGVRGTRTHLATRTYVEGSRWQLRALDADQRARLRPPAHPRPRRGRTSQFTTADRSLVRLLNTDGRRSYSALTSELGTSVNTIRRRVDALLACGHLTIRCELSRLLSDWPVSATLWAHVPVDELDRAADLISALPEVRLCVALTGGPANLLCSLWLHTADDVQRLETELADRLPRLRIIDRAVALRHFKRMGRLLNEHDTATDTVPLDAWPRS